MRILITGGTGLIGRSVVRHLGHEHHQLRILARGAKESAKAGSEAWPASVTDAKSLEGAATDCDVVLHIAGIAEEHPPEATFARVNVEGTRNVLREAEAAGVRRFVYVSSLGAESGRSDYHASKRAAEEIVRGFPQEWTIARPGNVYGPGDAVVSRLLTYVRSLPAVPLVDSGEHRFQPLWHDDAGRALARIVTSDGARQVHELAGPDSLSMRQLFDMLSELTRKNPIRLPLPSQLLSPVARTAEALGADLPIKPDMLQMLLDGNYIRAGRRNALLDLIEQPTDVRCGLQMLLHDLPEQALTDGVGTAQHRRVRVRMQGNGCSADALFAAFTNDFDRFVPLETAVEPSSDRTITAGAVLTLALPLRGNIAVRAVEVGDHAVTLATLEGHPLAGFVRFTFKQDGADVLFEVNVYDRPARALDAIGMALGGSFAQQRAWVETARRVADASGGELVGDIEHELRDLDDADAARVQEWLERATSPHR